MLYERLDGGKVRCALCAHRCTISPGRRGICHVRENRDGTLQSLVYGRLIAMNVDPIEKKPLFHFLPGSLSFSIATVGCNFRCLHCQNWNISQVTLEEVYTKEITPEEAVRRAVASGSKSISWTYNEPAIWHEYTYDSAMLAKKAGLKTVYVTNGYITPEALRRMAPYLDAYRVDIKSFSDEFYIKVCGARLAPVLESTKLAKELGMHVETITLVIPGRNDSKEELTQIAKWVKENLGEDTPMHFTRFHPMHKMDHVAPTPLSTLEMAHGIAKNEGMRFVYLGNFGGHKYENTFCPRCDTLLIDRAGFNVGEVRVKDGKCARCGEGIPVVG